MARLAFILFAVICTLTCSYQRVFQNQFLYRKVKFSSAVMASVPGDIADTSAVPYDQPVNIKTPIGSTPQFAIPGDSTVETNGQRAIFWTHWLLTFWSLYRATSQLHISSTLDMLNLPLVVFLSVIIGDFATGVFHWSVDNYGSIKTPVFGTVCAAFQGHHVTPWTITFRSFVNNVYKICIATVPFLLLLQITQTPPLWNIFLVLFINWWMISQELHKYAHMRSAPQMMKKLQDWGVVLSRKEHGQHHTAPFEGHYCILTGINNGWLDSSRFFRYLENIVFRLTGNRPNTWKESSGGAEVEAQSLSIFASIK